MLEGRSSTILSREKRRIQMRRIVLTATMIMAIVSVAYPAVNMVMRPAYQVAAEGDSVDIELVLVNDSFANQPISALDAIMFYNPNYLGFYDLVPAGAPYDWFLDGFFSPSTDGINDDIDDGEMLYTAYAQLGIPAYVTKSGLLVTTLRFFALQPACKTIVSMPATYGTWGKTCVFDGTIPNTDITGSLSPAFVKIVRAGVLKSVVEAKARPDGSAAFELEGPIVTRTYDNFFYIEDFDRAAGIRVNCDPSKMPSEGAAPPIVGSISTSSDGERVIIATDIGGGCAVPMPNSLGVNIRATKVGLCPVGLLACVSGRVAAVDADGEGFTLWDGSTLATGESVTIKVKLYCGTTAPAQGEFVTVRGAVGMDANAPVIRVGKQSDITLH